MPGVDAVIVQISREGSGARDFQTRDKNTRPQKNNLSTTFLYSREVGLLNCSDLDENHQPGDWVKCSPIWVDKRATRGGPNFQLNSRLLKKSSKKCEIAPQINEHGYESYFYNGIILSIYNVKDETKIKSFMLIWNDYMGLVCHFSPETNSDYQMLQVVNFKAVGMSESRHCAFHAVSVSPTNKVRFMNLRFCTAKVEVLNDMLYAHCENEDKVVLLDLETKSLLATTCGLQEGEEINVIYYRIETRMGKIYLSLCYFQNGEEDGEFWEAQMENLRKSCRASNEDDESLLNCTPSKNPLSSHDFRTYWNKYFPNFWDPEKDKLEWIVPFLISSDDISSTDTSQSCDESLDLTRSESNLGIPLMENQSVEEDQSIEPERHIDEEENSDKKSEKEATLTISSTSVPSSVYLFKEPVADSSCDSSIDSDKISEEASYDRTPSYTEGQEYVVTMEDPTPTLDAFQSLEVNSDDTVSISSSCGSASDLESNVDEHNAVQEDVSDSKTFVTADYMGGSRAASPDLEEMLEHGLAAIDDRQESEEPHEKEEYVAVNQEQLEKLEKECNFRHEILRPKIAELSTAEPDKFKMRRSSENSSILNSSTDSTHFAPLTIGRLEDPPLRPSHNRPRRKEVTPPCQPQQPETPLLVTDQSVYVPFFAASASPSTQWTTADTELVGFGLPNPSKKVRTLREEIPDNTKRINGNISKENGQNGSNSPLPRPTRAQDFIPPSIPITDQPVGHSVFSRHNSESSLSSPSPSTTNLKPDSRSLQMVSKDDSESINDYINRMLNPYDDQMGQVKRLILQYIMESRLVLRFIKKQYRCLFDCLTQMYKFPEFVCFYDLERLQIPGLLMESSGSPQVDRISMENQIFKYMYEHKDLWDEIVRNIECVNSMIEQFRHRI